jgi:hypothetical protein
MDVARATPIKAATNGRDLAGAETRKIRKWIGDTDMPGSLGLGVTYPSITTHLNRA